jgi:hypothetical protein
MLLALAALCTVVFEIRDSLAFPLMLSVVPVSILWIVVLPRMSRNGLERHVRTLYREGSNWGIIGGHEMELTDTHLIERNSCGESRRLLGTIEKVVCAEGYTFVYLNAVTAHIVPGDAVEEGHYQAFIAALEKQMAKAWTEAGTPKRVEHITSASHIRRSPAGGVAEKE